MNSIALRAPAKINLFLHITGRRSDGYHELQTAFQFLNLSDQLRVAESAGDSIELTGDTQGINTEDNLIYKAAMALKKASNSQLGATIDIQKTLPMGGGIGGGSSDAASTLLALNKLWKTELTLEQLAAIAAQLGADVPVFVRGQAAFAEGVGEKLHAIEVPEPWYLLLKPNCQVSTAQIFSHQELTRNTSPIRIAAFLSGAARTRNDCLPVVQKLYPQVRQAMAWLSEFSTPFLTGTGACIFASFDSEQAALAAQQQIPDQWQGFVAKGRNTSPAHEDLAKIKFPR